MDSRDATRGSFALDSISVHSCGYPQKDFVGTSYLDFDCDFDSPMDNTCGIKNDHRYLIPQTVSNCTIQSPNTINDRELGPRETSGWSGDQFLYWSRSADTSPLLINGQFKTPLIETNRDMCVRFSYFVNSTGVQPDENSTKLEVSARGCRVETIWSIQLDHSFGWQLVTIPLNDVAFTQALYFQINQLRIKRVAVAFDDITIAQCGALNVLTTTTKLPTTTAFNKSSSIHVNCILFLTILLCFLKMTTNII